MVALSLSAPPKSFVADFIILGAEGYTLSETNINDVLFEEAVELVSASECDDFDDITALLKEHSCDASCIFGVPVTPDTDIALAAYLLYNT